MPASVLIDSTPLESEQMALEDNSALNTCTAAQVNEPMAEQMRLEFESLQIRVQKAEADAEQAKENLRKQGNLLLAWRQRLGDQESIIQTLKRDRDKEMCEIASSVLLVQAELRKEQTDILRLVEDKETIIASQERQIHALLVLNRKLANMAGQSQSDIVWRNGTSETTPRRFNSKKVHFGKDPILRRTQSDANCSDLNLNGSVNGYSLDEEIVMNESCDDINEEEEVVVRSPWDKAAGRHIPTLEALDEVAEEILDGNCVNGFNGDCETPPPRENADCPVYIQRYVATVDVLRENAVENVIDFGCAELNFALRLKRDGFIKKVCAVDIDEHLLKNAVAKLKPLTVEYIESMRREQPLNYTVFCGSVAEEDERLLDYEAVTCIELIEHLENEVLKKLPTVVFGFLKPKVAIFTTPNSDFNVLFKDFSGFRHWDHKFEWSRKEFKEWCESILREFSHYSVEISGVGEPPAESIHLGCCSQMAVFKLLQNKTNMPIADKELQTQKNPYKLIAEINYPVKTAVSKEDQVYNLAIYYMTKISKTAKEDSSEPFLNISVAEIHQNEELLKICSEERVLREILCERGENIYKDPEGNFILKYQMYESDDLLSDDENYEICANNEHTHNDASDSDLWEI
uniref:Small RNA 2'-O-methyltransferase n=1 Tax=Strigamia maritima TaxID=126957 RepID=T1J9Z3_STRMM